jgi:hypothetical protein
MGTTLRKKRWRISPTPVKDLSLFGQMVIQRLDKTMKEGREERGEESL